MRRTFRSFWTVCVVLLFPIAAWAEFDPREVPTECDFTSVEETWVPNLATGVLTQRVTHTSICGLPGPGEQTITVTTEQRIGGVLVITEVKQGMTSASGDSSGVVYLTDWDVYDGSMTLISKQTHVYDREATVPGTWIQTWTFFDAAEAVTGYTSKEVEGIGAAECQVRWIYYDTTVRPDPVIPDGVPFPGGPAATGTVPPRKDGSSQWSPWSNVNPAVYEQIISVNVNDRREALQWLMYYGVDRPDGYTNPAGTYVSGVLMGDRFDNADPISGEPFIGLFHRRIRWSNENGSLVPQFGWTSDRDFNEVSGNWWQARVKQFDDGSIEFIESAHRVYDPYDPSVHNDTFITMAPPYYSITGQTTKVFIWDGVDFSEVSTEVDGEQNPLSQTIWTVEHH